MYKRACINKEMKILHSKMKFILVFLLFHGFFVDYCFNLSGLNLYYTNFALNNGDQHCLYYYVPEVNFASQFIEYCIRLSIEEQLFNYTDDTNALTFEDLYEKNITSQQLYEWLAPIDLIESYQNYLENNVSTSTFRFYNCTFPWFGPRCQYRFPKIKSLFDNEIEDIDDHEIHLIQTSLSTVSCYTYLQCDRVGDQGESGNACLDWREICDGKVDCIDGGHDEDLCWHLEINECDDKTEYRCHNGLCIPLAFLQDDEMNPDCLDRSDEILLISSTAKPLKFSAPKLYGFCFFDPAFRCDESMCHPSIGRKYGIPCGDGSCGIDIVTCKSERDMKLFDALWFRLNISNECRLSMQCFTKLIGTDFIISNCPHTDGYYTNSIKLYCPKLIILPPILFGHVRFVYTNNQSTVSQ